MKKWVKQLFCRHIYRTVAKDDLYTYHSIYSNRTNEHLYNTKDIVYTKQCIKCSKIKLVQGEEILI